MYFQSKIYNNSQIKINLIKYCINKSYVKILIYYKLLKSNFVGLYCTEVLIFWLLVAEAYMLLVYFECKMHNGNRLYLLQDV